MLRLDVDNGDPYAIPADNPFVGHPDYLPEIWALGLRNPWRWSFDRLTGDLWIADVGLGAWEEVNTVPSDEGGGYNFGWNRLEGPACALGALECDPTGLVMPAAAYDHSTGCSITGGYVYRGAAFPSLYGTYFYADYCTGTISALGRGEDGGLHAAPVRPTRGLVSAFGEDEAGELYFATLRENALYRLVLAIGDEIVTTTGE
jgi:hypothetical protein